MRFTYNLLDKQKLPQLRFVMKDDNLATLNESVIGADAYFTCGDLVFNYRLESGEIVSMDAYMPYYNDLPLADFKLPKAVQYGKLFVGDLTDAGVFDIQTLPLERSPKNMLHAGKGTSNTYINVGGSLIFGLQDEEIKDVYLTIET